MVGMMFYFLFLLGLGLFCYHSYRLKVYLFILVGLLPAFQATVHLWINIQCHNFAVLASIDKLSTYKATYKFGFLRAFYIWM